MNPVTYYWKDKSKGEEKQLGLIAEELFELVPEAVSYDKNGNIEAVSYTRLIPVLIKAIQELKIKIEVLEKNI